MTFRSCMGALIGFVAGLGTGAALAMIAVDQPPLRLIVEEADR